MPEPGVRSSSIVHRSPLVTHHSPASGGTEVPPEVEAQIQSLHGGGRPLSDSELVFFEPRFGRNFSQVRIHTDANAATSARALNGRSFALGHDIAFGTGECAVEAASGDKRLLAHELVHVIQGSCQWT